MLYTTKDVSRRIRREMVKNSRTKYLDVLIVPGEVVAVYVFMPEDISNLKLVRLRRNNAYRIGPPKHHRGTSSKCPPEAMEEKGMRTRR